MIGTIIRDDPFLHSLGLLNRLFPKMFGSPKDD